MLKVFAFLQNFGADLRHNDRGVTSVEYALLLTMIGVALIGAVAVFGGYSPASSEISHSDRVS